MGVLSVAIVSGSAHAQDLDAVQGQGQGQDAAIALPDHDVGGPSKNHLVVGVAAAYVPTYQGADSYRVLPLPVIDAAWGPLFINLRNGIGINAIDTDRFTIGVSAAPMQGYRRKDVSTGIGKLAFGLGARGFATVKLAGMVASLGVTKGVAGGNKGVIADVSIAYPVAVSSRLTLTPTIGTSWADAKYNNRYFGVDDIQSRASGLAAFHTGSGVKDVSASISASYRLTNRINVGASVGVTSLMGDVKDSPLVYHQTQPSSFLSLAYRF